MVIRICESSISKSIRNSLHLHKPHASSSFRLHFFSSPTRENGERTVAVVDYLLHEHKFSPDIALRVSAVVPFLKNPEITDSIFSFLKEKGFSQTQLENIVKRVPCVLSSNLNGTIRPKFKIFRDFRFSSSDVVEIISRDPWILTTSADKRLRRSMASFESALGSNVDLSRVVKNYGWFLKHDLEKSMIPNIDYMKSCGISSSQIRSFVYNFPRFFLYNPDTLKEFVKRVDEFGFKRDSKMYIHAVRAVGSMSAENWNLKWDVFRSIGFSDDDILAVFQRIPQVFTISVKKIKEIAKLLMDTGKYDISYVVDHPELLIFSVENRIRPRLKVLEILEGKNLLKKIPSMTTVFKITNRKFVENYVLPYSDELGNLFVCNSGSEVLKEL